MSDLFLGSWVLVPELSLYDFGSPPLSGVYEISGSGSTLQFRISWIPGDGGPERSIDYAGPADGSPQIVVPDGPAASDSFQVIRINDRTLDTTAFRNGETLAYARRVASHRGFRKLRLHWLEALEHLGSGSDLDDPPG